MSIFVVLPDTTFVGFTSLQIFPVISQEALSIELRGLE
jgi:hypothetical protein